MLGRYEPEFEVKLMLRTDLGFEEKTFIEEKMNLYVESYHMMLHDDGMTYSLKSPYEIGQGLHMGIFFFRKLERYKEYFAVLKYYSYLEGDINGRRISSIVVPSRDYRKFMEDRQIELTDWEKAVLIYNNPIASYDDKMRYLNKWMGQIKQIEKAFVDLPLLFRRKDIVHIMGTKLYGIVAGPADDEEEMQSAIEAGARVIGVNNRNLKDFTVDIGNSIRLRTLAPENVLFVAESGIKTAEDIEKLREAKVNGVLIGETLMRSPDKKAALEKLNGGSL